MKTMQFTVLARGHSPNRSPETFTLISDSWDDFGFKTLFVLYYANKTGNVTKIGFVRVASRDMKDDGSYTVLPPMFNQLPSRFFSLGQSREYYQELVKLSKVTRSKLLRALRDISADSDLYNEVKNEKVFTKSLLRDIPEHTVTTQFRRIIAGKAPLTPYNFSYIRKFTNNDTPSLLLGFNVMPNSTPPTNVHVIIGSNGVGKSKLLRDFVASAGGLNTALGSFQDDANISDSELTTAPFVNVVHVSYSAFDETYTVPDKPINGIKIHAVGLAADQLKSLDEQFMQSFLSCSTGPRRERLSIAVQTLEAADPLLADMMLSELVSPEVTVSVDELRKRFQLMSSGHKIVVLTVTRLVELVEEQSLVLLDEPETHLHPPLLSALVRAISDLAIDRNGVAIIATHSPVILQEVPKSCAWRLQRTGGDIRANRLNIESFGESVSRLTSEVFHLDVSKTGYHQVLDQLVERTGSAEAALDELNGQLGGEGLFILNSLSYKQDNNRV